MRALIRDKPPGIRTSLARLCRDTRRALGQTQDQLAAAVGVTRAHVSAIERNQANPTLEVVERLLDALGLEADLAARVPVVIGDRRTRDVVHARCTAYVQRRLVSSGWSVAREVEIIHGRSHGWIDILAFDPRTRTLLVIEVKTRLDDLGAIERQLGWYTRSAREAVRDRGWSPIRVIPWLLALASDECDARIRTDAGLWRDTFPVRAPAIQLLVDDPGAPWPGGRGLALIDPSSRRRSWLIRTRSDGRRRPAPFHGYADAAARIRRAP